MEALHDFDDVVGVAVDLEPEADCMHAVLRVHDLARERQHRRRVRLRLEGGGVGGALLCRGLQQDVERLELVEQPRLGGGLLERREAPVAEACAVDREELLGVRLVACGSVREAEVEARVREFVGDVAAFEREHALCLCACVSSRGTVLHDCSWLRCCW